MTTPIPSTRHGRRRAATAFSAGLALFLAACGGGGGNDPAGPEPATSVSGSAVKGVVRDGLVTVIELGDRIDGTDGRVVGTGSTDGFGRYDVALTGYRGGPTLVVVAGRADGSTRVVCDVLIDAPGDDCGPGIAFGDVYPVDGAFRLTALTSALPPNGGINAPRFNVTAISALIARTAATAAGPGVSVADAIRNASFIVNQLAGGIDVTATTPIDLTDPAAVTAATGDAAAFAALNAALLSLGTGDTPQAVIESALASLSQAITAGTLSNAQVQALVQVAQAQLVNVDAIDTTGLLTSLAETTGCADGSPCTGTYALAEPPPTLNADAVTRAKAFSTDIRTTVENYEDAFDPDSNLFVGRVRDVGEFSGDAVESLAEDIGEAVSQAVDLRDLGNTGGTITGFTSAGAPTVAQYSSTVSGGNETYRIVGTVGDNTLDITGVLPARNANGDITGTTLAATLSGTARTTAGAGVSLTVTGGSVSVVRRDGSIPAEDESNGGRNIDRATLDVTATLAQVNVANPLSFTGVVGVTAVQCNTDACAPGAGRNGTVIGTPTRVELNGTLTDATGNTVAGSFAVAVPEATARRFNYDQPYSSTNFVDGTVTISARTRLIDPVPPVEEAQVTLAFESTGWDDADEVPIGNATLSFVRGTTTLFRVTGGNSVADSGVRRLDITGTGGVAITLNNTSDRPNDEVDLSGVVTVDGQRAGVIQQLDSGLVRVVYDDGSFETLFN